MIRDAFAEATAIAAGYPPSAQAIEPGPTKEVSMDGLNLASECERVAVSSGASGLRNESLLNLVAKWRRDYIAAVRSELALMSALDQAKKARVPNSARVAAVGNGRWGFETIAEIDAYYADAIDRGDGAARQERDTLRADLTRVWEFRKQLNMDELEKTASDNWAKLDDLRTAIEQKPSTSATDLAAKAFCALVENIEVDQFFRLSDPEDDACFLTSLIADLGCSVGYDRREGEQVLFLQVPASLDRADPVTLALDRARDLCHAQLECSNREPLGKGKAGKPYKEEHDAWELEHTKMADAWWDAEDVVAKTPAQGVAGIAAKLRWLAGRLDEEADRAPFQETNAIAIHQIIDDLARILPLEAGLPA